MKEGVMNRQIIPITGGDSSADPIVASVLSKFTVRVTVRGDCGRIHSSFESWRECQTCEAVLHSRLRQHA